MLKLKTILLICFFTSGLAMSESLYAGQCEPWVAKLVSVEGRVDVRRAESKRWVKASTEDLYCFGDRIRVAANARASVELSNDTILRLDQHSTLLLPEPRQKSLFFIELLKGALHVISRVKTQLEVRTPFVNAGLEGTEFVVRIVEKATIVSVLEGRVAVSNPLGMLSLTAGQSARGSKSSAPVLMLDLSPEDAVQWAIHYPLIAHPESSGVGGEIARAQRLLMVGRATEARGVLQALLDDAPDDADALAMSAVIELAQNRKEAALQLATQAVHVAPGSAVALLALSFAQQAYFRLHAAVESIETVIEQQPENAIAWSRLAELRSSLGDRSGALKAAKRAAELDPDLSRTQTVLGFSQLIRFETTAARASFIRATELDSSDPLARLGLGLAKIRDGELAAGRRDMEIAVSLDPANSLVRSYLGKAYLEEGRNHLAEAEFELAKQLDPKDPTPWLYSALKKHAENRQVEAIDELQQSLRSNDNRAVYRSRLLLDEDAAVHGVNLAALYSELGFDRLAITESSHSINGFQSNHAAHRFLATALLGQPRQGITQVSELLQSQLYQPAGIHGESPKSTIRELNRYTGLIASTPGPGEYTALFEGQGDRLTLNGEGGNQGTGGGEVVLSGLNGTTAYSLGYFKFETDGFRDNFDLSQEAYNAFVQSDVTDQLNLQLELRHRDSEQGNIRLRLDPAPVPEERRRLREDTYRVGGHVRLGADSHIIGSISYTDREESVFQPFVSRVDKRRGFSSELQLTQNFEAFEAVAGIGVYRIGGEKERRAIIVVPPIPPFFPGLEFEETEKNKGDIDAENVYLYTNGKSIPNLNWTLGFSLDYYRDSLNDIDQNLFNPKLGFEWRMDDRHRLRGAYFKTLKRNLPVQATIEPTQIAGFSQFFDDFNGDRARNLALAIDSMLTKNLDGTLAVRRRDTNNPASVDELEEKAFDIDLFWKLDKHWSLSGGYHWEYDEFTRGRNFDLKNQAVPVKLTYNSPVGYFGSLGAQYIKQNLRENSNGFDDEFATWNFSLGYLLPHRSGRLVLEVDNIFDKKFGYEDNGYKVADLLDLYIPFVPERTARLSLQLNF